MSVTITLQSPDTPDASALIAELAAVLAPLYPEQSRHGYSVEKLIREGVAFFVGSVAAQPAGCGGLQVVGDEYAEIKRMYVRPQFRRRGGCEAGAGAAISRSASITSIALYRCGARFCTRSSSLPVSASRCSRKWS